MADCPSVCEHLHLPVQSGDDAVLRRMGRQYTVDAYLERLGRRPCRRPRHRHLDRRHRRLLRRDRGAVRGDARAPARGPLRPGLRGRLLVRPGTPAARLADDVPAAEKRRRLNALLDLQEGIGLERNRAWLGRTIEVLVDAIVPPGATTTIEHDGRPERRRSASQAAEAPGPPGRPLPRQQARPPRRPGDPARHRSSACASTTPARTRCGEPSPEPARGRHAPVTAPPLIVIGGATATGKTGLAARARRSAHRGGGRRDHLGRLAPGLPRPRHRHGQGDCRASGPGCRITASTSSSPDEPFTVGRLRPAATAALEAIGRPRRGRDPRRRHRAVPARGRRRPRPAALPSDAATRARLEAELVTAGTGACAARLPFDRPDPRRSDRPAQPAPRRARPRDRASCAATARCRRRAGYPGPVAWVGLTGRARRAPAPDRRPCPRPVRRRPDRRSGRPASAVRPALPAFTAIGYPEAWAVLDGALTREAAIERDAARNVAFAKRQRTWFRAERAIEWRDATNGLPLAAVLEVTRRLG